MNNLACRELHSNHGANFGAINGTEAVLRYEDVYSEHAALVSSAGLMDLSMRSRVCVTGADRQRFLNGQVTNSIKALSPGRGCYAALVTAKGRMESDLIVHCLSEELLLDFEPGLTRRIITRLERYIVADEVAVVDIETAFGLLSVQGPRAAEVLELSQLAPSLPDDFLASCITEVPGVGEVVLVRHARFGKDGFDLFAPVAGLALMFERLRPAVRTVGGRPCGWEAAEIARVEAGIPRFGQDMDETTIPLEAGLEARAVSYTKGCYIGQEVINRIHTMGQVAKSLHGLLLDPSLRELPTRGARIKLEGKDVGFITSAVHSPGLNRPIALGYLRREVDEADPRLKVTHGGGESEARITGLPFGSSRD